MRRETRLRGQFQDTEAEARREQEAGRNLRAGEAFISLTPQLLVAPRSFFFLLGIRCQVQCLGRPLGTAIRFTSPTTIACLLAPFTNNDFANNSWLTMIQPVKPDNKQGDTGGGRGRRIGEGGRSPVSYFFKATQDQDNKGSGSERAVHFLSLLGTLWRPQ